MNWRLVPGAFLLMVPLWARIAQSAEPTAYDIVIRNGRVLDGLGNPWVRADVAIKDGRFAKIGKVSARGRREIDASGAYVSPGWIDMMDQSGEVLLHFGPSCDAFTFKSRFLPPNQLGAPVDMKPDPWCMGRA